MFVASKYDYFKKPCCFDGKITKSNFHVILSEHLNDAVTVDQFAQIFSAVLTEHIDDVLYD